MRRLFKGIILGIAMMLSTQLSARPVVSRGAGDSLVVMQTHPIAFRVNSSYIEPDYMNNAASIARLDLTVRELIGTALIDTVKFISTASPEAPYEYNLWLAERRSASLKRFLLGRYPALGEQKVAIRDVNTYIKEGKTVYPAENWALMREMVESDDSLSTANKNILLGIIDSDATPDDKEKAIAESVLGQIVVERYYPYLRCSQIVIICRRSEYLPMAKMPLREIESVLPEQPIAIPEPMPQSDTIFRPAIAFKTNMLYDAVGGVNAQIEVPICPWLSVEVSDIFPWFNGGPNGNFWAYQVLELGAAAKFWLGPGALRDAHGKKIPMTGLYVGPYAASSKYDLQWDHKLEQRGEYWSAGMEVGWSKHLKSWAKGYLGLNLEFTVGVGYADIEARHYYPGDEYEALYHDYDGMRRIRWFGPTRAKVSLVIPINYRKTHTNE